MLMELEFTGRVAADPLPPYVADNYQSVTVLLDGKVFAGSQALAAVASGDASAVGSEGIDWSPCAGLRLLRFDRSTEKEADEVYERLNTLRQGDMVKGTIHLTLRIVNKGNQPTFTCMSVELVSKAGAVGGRRVFQPELAKK